MKQSLLVRIVGVFAVLAVVWYINPFASEEDRVLEVLSEIEATYYLNKGENKLQYAARVAQLSELFSKEIRTDLIMKYREPMRFADKQNVKSAMITGGLQLGEFSIDFVDTKVKVQGNKATVNTACEVMYQDGQVEQASDLVIEFKNQNGDWLVHRVNNTTPWEF